MADLTIQSNVNVGIMEIILEGSLNETASFDSLDLSTIEEIYIDFNKVSFINSSGINKWIRWTQNLEENFPSIAIHFCNCPKIIIDQINSVKGFLPKQAKVESFWLPFYCEESDRRDFVLMIRGKQYMEKTSDGEDWVKLPECNCSETQTPCEPDIMPAKYFSFLKGLN